MKVTSGKARALRRVFKTKHAWFRSGPPIFEPLLPKWRQRSNLRYQEKKNLNSWSQSNLYRNLPIEGGAIFLHIPKTAGTAVADALRANTGFHWLDPKEAPASNRVLIPHFQLDWLVTKGILSRHFVDSVPVISVVRHPATRAISAYRYLKKIGHLPEAWTLTMFLTYLHFENPKIGGAQVSRLAHAAPQHRWLENASCRPSITVFRQERLSSLAEWTRLNFGEEVLLKSTSTSSDRQLENLNRVEQFLVRKAYAKDFSLLKYSRYTPVFEESSFKFK